MNIEHIICVVNEINDYIKKQMWLDFEVLSYENYTLSIIGSIDISSEHDIKIIFNDVSFISMPFEWKTDTSVEALILVTGEEAVIMNRKFQVERGHYIFKFVPESFLGDFGCYLAAKTISYQINKKTSPNKM